MSTGSIIISNGGGLELIKNTLNLFYDVLKQLYQSGTLLKILFYVGIALIIGLLFILIRHFFTKHRRR